MRYEPSKESEMSIFLADDDVKDRDDVIEEFKKSRRAIDLRTYTNGAELVGALKEADTAPDCILLDMNMPVMDGFGVLNFLQSDHKMGEQTIAVFVMVSSDVHREILQEKGCHPTAFISKPVRYSEVVSLLKQHS